MAHDKQLSGYDFDFVEDPPDYLCCMIICNLPFRNPQLVNCCGARYCEPCIERWISEKGPQCPNCRAECRHMEDKSVEREVLSLKVRCSHGADCSWEGELRHLDKHLHTVHAAPAVVHAHVGKSKQEGRVNSVKEVKVKFWFWTWAVALGKSVKMIDQNYNDVSLYTCSCLVSSCNLVSELVEYE